MISYNRDGAVGLIRIDRQKRRNAINFEALEELEAALVESTDDGLRCLILTGAGGHFCAGADLSELEDKSFAIRLRRVLDRLVELPIPTVAAISGACMGLGAQLAMACDLRVAATDARFAVPVAKIGLMVDFWTVRKLASLAGHSTARQMLLTGQPVSAERAYEVGFVQWLAADGADPLALAREIAEGLAVLAPLSIEGSKLGLEIVERDLGLSDSEDLYREAFDRAWSSSDLFEGQTAFNERRAPKFEGR